MLSNSTILITGGGGFLGSHLTEELIRRYPNSKVKILDNFSSCKKDYVQNTGAEIIEGDVRNFNLVSSAVKDADVVFHLAAQPFIPDCYQNPEEFITTNINGTFNLIRAVRGIDLKSFILMSTSEVYGTAQYVPIDEKHPTVPHSTYAAAKLAAENIGFTLYKEHYYPLTIIRSFNFYGPRDTHPRIIPELLKQFTKENKLNLGNINATRDFLYVKDVANGLIAAAQCKKAIGETINLSTGIETPLRELINIISEHMNKESFAINVERARLRPLDVNRLCGNNAKAKALLEWTPSYSLQQGLKETIEWYSREKEWVWEKGYGKTGN